MAGTPSTIVSVTPGPVPPVSARSGSSLLGSKDGVTPAGDTHDDLLPPPSPSKPYEVFLAHVGHATSHSSGPTMQPAAAALPSPSVTTVTTGNHIPMPFPTYEVSSWMHQSQLQASRIRMPLPASFYTPLPSPWVWPGRGSAVTTSVVRAYLLRRRLPSQDFQDLQNTSQDPSQEALHLYHHLPSCSSRHWNALSYHPALSRSFFECHAPFSSSQPGTLYHRPPQDLPLWLPRWRNQMLWTLHRALPRTWSRAGKRVHAGHENLLESVWWWRSTSANRGSRCSVRKHGPQLAAVTESLWSVDPARGLLLTDIGPGSDTAKRLLTPPPTRRLSPVQTRFTLYYVRPDQNEQTAASVRAIDPARGLLLTDIGPGSDTAKCLLTPLPRPDTCLLPPNTHGLAVAMFPVGPVHLKVVRGLRGLVFFGDPAHLYHVAVVHHRRSRDSLAPSRRPFRGWHD